MPGNDFQLLDPDASKKRTGAAVDPYRVGRALWRGKWWIVGTAVVGLALGLVAAKTLVKSPFETAALLKYQAALAHVEGLAPPDLGTFGAATQALSMQSVLAEVKNRVGFTGDLTALSRIVEYTTDSPNQVVRVQVSADSAEGAAELSKTVADVFIEHHEKRQLGRIRAEIAVVNARLAAATAEAERARDAYQVFREEHGIADVGAEQTDARESAAKLAANAELATSEIRALEARVKAIEAQLAQTPKTQVVVGGRSPELSQYRKLRVELAKARSTYSAEHPQVRSLESQVAALQRQLKSGRVQSTGTGTVSVNKTHEALRTQLRAATTNLESLRERQKGLQSLASKAQERAETFSEFEGEASSLLTQIKVNEGLVKELKATRAYLEDGLLNPSSGFIILDPGAIPEYATRSRTKYLVFGGVPAVLVGIVLLFVLGRELRGLRVRTPAELGYWGQGPVVGSTSWPKDPDAMEDLVAGMDDYAPDANGNLLIVGASEYEEDLACELAARLNDDWFPTSTDSIGHPPVSATPAPAPAASGRPASPYPVSPYPLARVQPSRQSITASRHPQDMTIEAWIGPSKGQALRRAARLADRVVVLVHSGAMSTMELSAMRARLGRKDGIGYILVGLDRELEHLPDRAGDVDEFWKTAKT